MEGFCNDTSCSKDKDKRITELEKDIEKKMDKDGEFGAFHLFQKRIPWRWWVGIFIAVGLSVGGGLLTTGNNIYSSEFKFAKKEEFTTFKECTNVKLTSFGKDINSINTNIENLSTEQVAIKKLVSETKKEIFDEIKKSDESQRRLLEEHTKSLERLIKGFHRNTNRDSNGG